MTRTPARRTVSFSVVSRCSTLEKVATAETAREIARAYGVDDATAARALAIREVAINSIARKIFSSDAVDLIFARYSRCCAPI